MSEIFRALNFNNQARRRRDTSTKRVKNTTEWPALPGNSDISSLGSSHFKASGDSGSPQGSRTTLQSFSSGHFDTDQSIVSETGSQRLISSLIKEAEN